MSRTEVSITQPIETLCGIAIKLRQNERQQFLDLVLQVDKGLGQELKLVVNHSQSFRRTGEETTTHGLVIDLPGLHSAKSEAYTTVDPLEEMTVSTALARNEEPYGKGIRRLQDEEPEKNIPEQIGPYQVISKLGSGAQGMVLLVRQSHPDRKLALKLIHSSLFHDQMFLARFQREYQILSSMNHHHIAKIYEVGKDEERLLYFTMEYVEGCTITHYCQENKLDLKARLRLFCQVCDGVQHAHRKLVLHRDIKPQNVLVTEVDGVPVVKIIDFGIAKTIEQSNDDFQTQADWVGTPLYMGPELFAGSAPDICGDIYGMGMLLYELITDQQPFDRKRLKGLVRDEVLRVYRTENPPRPSKRKLEGVVGTIDEDLDWLVMKAIHKEPDLRYATVAELHEDCLNYLADRPVIAKPPEWSYLVEKFVRRNKALVASSTLVFSLLLMALVITSLARKTSEEARRRYEKSFQTLESVLTAPRILGVEARVIDLLQTAEVDFENDFGDDPQLEAAIRTVWGNTYFGLNLYEKAKNHLETCVSLLMGQKGEFHPETLRVRYYLARVMIRLGENKKAQIQLEYAYWNQKEQLGVAPDTLDTLALLAYQHFKQGDGKAAAELLQEAESMINEMPANAAKAKFLNVLATTQSGNKFDAQDLFRQALKIQKRVLGPTHGNTLATMSNIANDLRNRGKYAESIPVYEELIGIREKKLGSNHDRTLLARQGLALCFLYSNRLGEAEQIMRDVGQHFEQSKILARSLNAQWILGNILNESGQQEEAMKLYQSLLERTPKGMHNSPIVLKCRASLSDLLISLGHFEEAQYLLTETLASMTLHYGEADLTTIAVGVTLAQAYEGMNLHEAAEQHYTEAITTLAWHHPKTPALAYYQAIRAFNLIHLERAEEAKQLLLECLERSAGPYRTAIRAILNRLYQTRICSDETTGYDSP